MTEFVVVCDTREQLPYEFSDDVEVVHEKLDTGDYTVQGFEKVFAVERKSLPDLLKSITWERERFKREIIRSEELLGFAVVVESSLQDVLNWNYHREVHPNAVMGTVRNWKKYHCVDFVWAGDRESAELETLSILRRWWESYNSLID